MPTRRQIGFVCVVAALFLLANRASYKGYFSGDDLAAIALMRQVTFGQWLKTLVTPVFNPDNFRPIGYALYGLLDRAFDNAGNLNFAPYLAAVQILHGVVTLLVYTLARRFGASTWAATIGALFFAFHMALFGAFWKPMYNFDIFCALFVIVSILAWQKMGWRWWLASFVSFWLAYKSKEVAVMLPAVLFLIEYRGPRRWLRLAPFVAVSLSFGLQAVLTNQSGAYHLALTPQTLAQTASYYADHVMLARIGIIALLAVVALARERWPILAALLFLAPMLALPGRTAAVYLYVPMVFVAILAAMAAERAPKCAVITLVIWLSFNFAEMRRMRSDALAEATDARTYVTQVTAHPTELSEFEKVILDGYPKSINVWGAEATVFLTRGPHARGSRWVHTYPMSVSWQPAEKRAYIFSIHSGVPSHLNMRTGTWLLPVYSRDLVPNSITVAPEAGPQLYEPELETRWSKPLSLVGLDWPRSSTEFELTIFVPQQQLDAAGGRIRVAVEIGRGVSGELVATSAGEHQVVWQVPPGYVVHLHPLQDFDIHLHVTPTFKPDPNGRELGVAVQSIGFR